jgi:indole-3-glycerol phosphate synthase
MNILEKIIASKKKAIQLAMQTLYFNRPVFSLKKILAEKEQFHIIAEYKRKSPSKGVIQASALVQDVVPLYMKYGAAACSILTDQEFFGGSNNDILTIRDQVSIPLLQKDFIISSYQVLEARSIGADIILLIAACLNKETVKELAGLAKQLGLEVLLEIHDEMELEYMNQHIDFVGVNNRDLRSFTVDLNRSIELRQKIGNDFFTIAESGIGSPDDLLQLKTAGFNGFLMGEYFMKTEDPGRTFHKLINVLQNKTNR